MAERVNIVDECRYCGKNCIGQGVCSKCLAKLPLVKKVIKEGQALRDRLSLLAKAEKRTKKGG